MSLQEFIKGLNMEQCYKLLVEAYGCNGGLQMAKAFLPSGDPVQQPQPGICAKATTWNLCKSHNLTYLLCPVAGRPRGIAQKQWTCD